MSTYTERARALRPYIVKSAASLTDADASLAPELFTRLTGSGSLVKAGMRINWGGTITVKMGKPMPLERAEAEKAAAQHTAATLMGMPVYTAIGEERAKDLRYAIETAAASLDDKTASEAPELFPKLTGDGSLVKSGTRICWQGGIKRAAVDLWDTAQNTPDAAPDLWEDIAYKQGFRLIPETITAGLAFSKGEKGWWQDELYESLLAANVWNPSVNPDGWKKITEEGT